MTEAVPAEPRGPVPRWATGDTRAKGADLEQRVAAFLRDAGYDVRTNVVLEGRSGARHEIDVLAEKSDGFTSFRLAVECKAWEHPVEKDVVAKLAHVLGDVGLHKGIVASKGGYRSGAAIAAEQLGIEIWGAEELAQHLGGYGFASLGSDRSRISAVGFPFELAEAAARRRVESEARGRLGIGAEEIAWFSPVWVPAAMMRIALSRPEGRIKKVLQTRRIWNIYDLLTGGLLSSAVVELHPTEVEIGDRGIRPRTKPKDAIRGVNEAFSRYCAVST
ncbi:MAG: restriction endonuclease, partial [Ilumatobacteraceae bacterium]